MSENGRFLVREDGQPFFWMADTAWELIHRCSREEIELYLTTRQQQGFNVIQTVALAEINGLNDPNPYGHIPLVEGDPNQPNPKYFEHVDYLMNRAQELGMYIALLPSWGDKLFKNSWGVGPEVLNPPNARQYGQWLGERYRDQENIIWIIGGDRNPRENSQDVEVWRALAEGILEGVGGIDNALMSFHPQPKSDGGSSTWFHEDEWLDFNMHQTGHCPNKATYRQINHDYQLMPIKPVVDGEPLYEDHPNCFNADELGYSRAQDIRRIMYQNVFAGAFGQSYGCHAVWQMYRQGREGINYPLRPWPLALQLPMAQQVKHLKNLMLSRPFLTRIPDQSLIVNNPQDYQKHIMATRDSEGNYAMIYLPTGGQVTLDLSILTSKNLTYLWYDPRTGAQFGTKQIEQSSATEIIAPSAGPGNDWVLIIDVKQ